MNFNYNRIAPEKPKYFIGGALAIGGLAMSVASSIKKGKDQRKANNQAVAEQRENNRVSMVREYQDLLETDSINANNFANNIPQMGFYAKGGNIQGVQQEASDMSVAYGATHGQPSPYGGTGVPYGDVEVEGGGSQGNKAGEVIQHGEDGDFVFSDRMSPDGEKSYAELAQELTYQKSGFEDLIRLGEEDRKKNLMSLGKSDDSLKTKGMFKRNQNIDFKSNNIAKQIAEIDAKIEELKASQIQQGQAEGIYDEEGNPIEQQPEQMALGGFSKFFDKYGSEINLASGILNTGVNYMTNKNTANAAQRMKIERSVPMKSITIPKISKSNEKAKVKSSEAAYNKYVEDNLSNPQSAAIAKQASRNVTTEQLGSIQQAEDTANTGIIAQNAGNNMHIQRMNRDADMRFQEMSYQKGIADIDRTAKVTGVLMDDINSVIQGQMHLANQNKTLDLYGKMWTPSVNREVLGGTGSTPSTSANTNSPGIASFQAKNLGINPMFEQEYLKTMRPDLSNDNPFAPKGFNFNRKRFGKMAKGGQLDFSNGVDYDRLKRLNPQVASTTPVDGKSTPSSKSKQQPNSQFGSSGMNTAPMADMNIKPTRYESMNNGILPLLKQAQSQVQYEGKGDDGLTVNPLLRGLYDLMKDHGIEGKFTSGLRTGKGAVTSGGKRSKHSVNEAADFVPTNMDFNKMYSIMFTTPKITEYMGTHNMGVIREDDPRVLKKTGGTGAHGHISINEDIANAIWDTKYYDNGSYTDEFYKKYNIG